MGKFKKCAVTLLLTVVLMLCMMTSALAREIYGNGTGGIWIDIDQTPYSDAWDPRWGRPYSDVGCTWFAAARIEQLTGINLQGIIYGADQWWNTVYARHGFTRSSTLNSAYKAVACWYDWKTSDPNDDTAHMAIVEGFDANGRIIVSEGGIRGLSDYNGYCWITTFGSEYELTSKNSGFLGFIILPVAATRAGAHLDVNGFLDGEMNGTLVNYGTFDMYINGTRAADDVYDYYNQSLPIGTAYRIDDIRPCEGYTYEGVHSGYLEGTVAASGIDVRLSFNSYSTLKVGAMLDNATSDSTDGFGTFDVYINGALDEAQTTSYSKNWPQGTNYEIKNISTADGKYFNGVVAGGENGTLGKGVNAVTLSFSTIAQAGADWREESALPGYIDPETVEIEYNNYYEQTAESAPGEGWTQVAGSAVTTYVNDGAVYTSPFAQADTDTCVCVGSGYYHYCGASMGNRVNFAYTDQYNTYHEAYPVESFNVTGQWTDDDDPRYIAYQLTWNTGEWAGGTATCAAGRSAIWYRQYQYQNRKAVTTYKWVKETGWGAEVDSAAAYTKVRFRLKQYEVSFDANGGEGAPENQVKHHGIDLTISDVIPQLPAFGFVGWNTQADGKGEMFMPGDVYATDAPLTLFAQWSSLSRMVLPAGLKTIEAYAFENVGAVIVEIPTGCESIGMGAFRNCAELVQIFIPDSVKNIAFDAFDGCDKLTICAPEDSAAIRFAKALGIDYEIVE